MKEDFVPLLLNWYKQNARSLPWRGHPDPYAVWVSEIMLQQTRVETVIPYFLRWLERFPDISSLAGADENEVLRSWEGLGYYSRARSLHKSAKELLSRFGGLLPRDYETLLKLPGIGPYTAAAIASIAFGEDRAVVDGNVKRVLARVFNFTEPVNTPAAEKELRSFAQSLLPAGNAGDYNQAVMDLGAVICTPVSPECQKCPVRLICYAYEHDLQTMLPQTLRKPPIPHIVVTAAILHRDGRVLIARRPSKGLLGGLWEFPGGKVEEDELHSHALARELSEELGIDSMVKDFFGEYRHAYTHFRVTLFAYKTEIITGEPVPLEASELRWVCIEDLSNFPMGKIDRQIALDLQKGDADNG